jgi:PAS domain S-box-containing protein
MNLATSIFLWALGLTGAGLLWWAPRRAARARERSLASRLAKLEKQATESAAALERSEAVREAAQAELRAAEEREALAQRGSQDGMWEWDIIGGAVHLSPRWKGMLGLESDGRPDDRASWLARVHDEDRTGFEAALQRHLQGNAPRFEHEMRLLHRDGSVRHVLSRAVALRHDNGSAYRMVGLDTDVTRLRRVQNVLDAVAAGTSGAFGERFFAAMAQHFARALGVDTAFITECLDEPPTHVRTLACWRTGQGLVENFEFALAGTPCDAVVNHGQPCFLPRDVGKLFPRDAEYEAYLGMPIIASDGRVLGHLALFHRQTLDDTVLVDLVYRIFLARAAAEIERLHALAQLARLAPAA